MTEHAGPRQLRLLLDAVMAVGSGLELSAVLRRVVETATELAGARHGALGVLDADGTHLVEFITVGVDDETRARIGELPKGHGLLGSLISDPRPIRVPDLREHPERFGFPPNHPPMTSFLGVPLYVRGEVFGNLYLTDKRDGEVFTDIDEELVASLAAAAAIAIENVRLHQRTQELAVVAEQERIGRDLHDTVVQQLFAVGLAMQTTAGLIGDPLPRERLEAHIDAIDTTIRQVRSAIFELDSVRVLASGLRREVLGVAAEAARVLGFEPQVVLDGPLDTAIDGAVGAQVVAVLREALSNVARHAGASRVEVLVVVRGGPARRGRRRRHRRARHTCGWQRAAQHRPPRRGTRWPRRHRPGPWRRYRHPVGGTWARTRHCAELTGGDLRPYRSELPPASVWAVVVDRNGLDILTPAECRELLTHARVGRVGLSSGALPIVLPVNYALVDQDILVRSSPGTKLDAALAGSVVAFEVDHSDESGQTGWSVLVQGVASVIVDPGELETARGLGVRAWAGDDDRFVRIGTARISGRRLT